jgi:hypothetical protein
MAVSLLALRTGSALPPTPQNDRLILICVRGLVNPKDVVRLEGLGKLKNIQ